MNRRDFLRSTALAVALEPVAAKAMSSDLTAAEELVSLPGVTDSVAALQAGRRSFPLTNYFGADAVQTLTCLSDGGDALRIKTRELRDCGVTWSSWSANKAVALSGNSPPLPALHRPLATA